MFDLILDNIFTINFVLINIALALSIYLTLATGLLSLANAGFLGIGAYTVAIGVSQAKLPVEVGFVLALVVAAVIAWPLGRLVLRLRDVYLAIATIGFGEIVRILALNGDKILRAITGNDTLEVFNGAQGIILPYATPATFAGLPVTTWSLLLYLAAVILLLAAIRNSHYGRVLAAIRLDEPAAATLGIDVLRYKLLAFVAGAIIAAGVGALSAPIIRVIDPRNYVFSRAVDILAFAVFGGTTHWLGPIVGAVVLSGLPEVLRFLKERREIVNGLIIMLAIIYLPRGITDPKFWLSWRRK